MNVSPDDPSAARSPRASTRSSRPSATDPRPRSRASTLLPVAIIVLGLAEIAILVGIGVATSLWWSVLIVVVGWVVAIALVITAGQQSFTRLRSLMRAVSGRGDVQDHLSRPAFTLLSALLFAFPGLITDVVGIVLLLTPVQRRSVRAMGLAGGSDSARTVLYRRSGSGVVDGEIILEAQPVPPRPAPPGGPTRPGGTPPTITQT